MLYPLPCCELVITVACAYQAPLAGFNFTSFPDLVTADRLHIDTGMWGHVLGYMRGNLPRPAIEAVDAALSGVQPSPALVKPAGGLGDPSSLKSAAQVLSLARLLLVDLLADKRAACFIPIVRGRSTSEMEQHCSEVAVGSEQWPKSYATYACRPNS